MTSSDDGSDEGATPEPSTSPPRMRAGGMLRRAALAAWEGRGRLLVFLAGLIVGVVLTVWAFSVRDSDPVGPMTQDPSPDITVTMSAGLLTALVQQSVARGQSPVPIENVRVETRDNRLIIRGDFVVLSRNISGSVQMEPVIENNQVKIKVRQARLGPIPVPGNLEGLAEGPIDERVDAALGNLPATITGVRVSDAGLTVTARVNVDQLVLPR